MARLTRNGKSMALSANTREPDESYTRGRSGGNKGTQGPPNLYGRKQFCDCGAKGIHYDEDGDAVCMSCGLQKRAA